MELGYERRQELLDPPGSGIFIDNVFDPSPAWRAGVRAGDVLLKMGGESMYSVAQFQRWLYLNGIGTEVELELSRERRRFERTMTIEERPPSATTR